MGRRGPGVACGLLFLIAQQGTGQPVDRFRPLFEPLQPFSTRLAFGEMPFGARPFFRQEGPQPVSVEKFFHQMVRMRQQ